MSGAREGDRGRATREEAGRERKQNVAVGKHRRREMGAEKGGKTSEKEGRADRGRGEQKGAEGKREEKRGEESI